MNTYSGFINTLKNLIKISYIVRLTGNGPKISEMLINNGANVNYSRKSDGMSPLSLAACDSTNLFDI